MRYILSKKELRQLEIIEQLFFSETHKLNETYLQSHLKLNDRLLKNEIKDINKKFSYLTIQYYSSTYQINFIDHVSIDQVYRDLLHHSTSFQLLQLLFEQGQLTSEDIEMRLYISPSTIYRMVNTMTPILESRFGFTIETSPYRLVGNEGNIRHFYSKYYLDTYTIFDWPFDSIDQDFVSEVSKYLLNIASLPSNLFDFRRLQYEAAVNLIRTHQNHDFQIKCNRLTELLKKTYQEQPELFNDFYHQFNQELTLEFISNFAAIYADDHFSYGYNDLMKQIENDSVSKQAVEYLIQFIDQLQDSYGIPLSNKEELLLELYNVVFLELRTNESTYLLYPRFPQFENLIGKLFPVFHQKVKEGLDIYLELLLGEYPKGLLHALLYSFYTYWNDLFINLENKILPIKTLVLSDFNQNHSDMIKDMLTQEFSKDLDVHLWSSLTITHKDLETSDFELIISSFTLDNISGKKCYSLSNLPTEIDFINIKKVITDIKEQRIMAKYLKQTNK